MDRNKTLDRLERALIAGLINRGTFIVGAMATERSKHPSCWPEHAGSNRGCGGYGATTYSA